MKVGILSMQKVINYGSVLQAYSLKQLVEEIYPEAKVGFIDINDEFLISCDKRIKDNIDYTQVNPTKRSFFRKVKDKLFRFLNKKHAEKIERFAETYLYAHQNDEPYDCVIIGSDEVLNNTHGVNLQLYGKICNAKKIIMYAASCGSASIDDISPEIRQEIKEALKNVSTISVRDNGTLQYIKNFTDNMIFYHLDPVLVGNLRNRKTNKVRLKNYMVIYAYGGRMHKQEEIIAIKSFAKKNGLKTVCIGGTQGWCDIYIPLSPFEVLDYFASAEYVVTDTFHGTIFSAILHKKFVSIYRETNSNKMSNLLQDLGLESRRLKDLKDLEEIISADIDYELVDKILLESREKTKEYLKENLV